ncbi:MAG: hypothetical protein MR717_09055 [Prevotella sp.]|nr:hypothetical protein [Prevotella sp.]
MAKRKKNPAIITKADYSCYVIYELRCGYGYHKFKDMMSVAREDLNLRKSRTQKLRRTEYNKIGDEDFSSIKYVGEMTLKNVVDHIDRVCYSESCDTMGMLTEHGYMYAVSFDSWSQNECNRSFTQDELKSALRDMYDKSIYLNQWVINRNIYVNVSVSDKRIGEALKSITGKEWGELDDAERKKFSGQFELLHNAYDKLYRYLKSIVGNPTKMPSDKELEVDFRQTCIDFNEHQNI